MKKIIALIILSITLGSCGLYSKYKRPEEAKVADSLYRTPSVDTNSIAKLSFKEIFTDTMLQNLINKGLQNNTNLQIAKLKVTEAEAVLKSARLAYLPSLSFAPQASASTSGYGAGSPTYSLALSASWEVDIFGKLTNAKLGSKAALYQSQAYQQAVQTQLIATIANSYYSLLMLDTQLEISKNTAKVWSENVRVMNALKQAGRTTQAAVSQSEASYLAVQSSLLALERQIYEVENSISSLLGEPSKNIKRGSLNQQSFPDSLSIGVPLQLLANRPDIAQAEQALVQAFYATNQARSAFYPSITLGGTAGWTNSLGAVMNPGSWLLNALGSLVQPIFNRGLLNAKLKIAKAQQEEALLSFRQSLLDAGNEVNNALMMWQTSRKRLEFDEKQVAALKVAVTSSKLLMQHSDASYLEVLTAQQTLLNAQLNQVTNKFNEIQGVISLYHALGGGVE